jgi:hypothetical protein
MLTTVVFAALALALPSAALAHHHGRHHSRHHHAHHATVRLVQFGAPSTPTTAPTTTGSPTTPPASLTTGPAGKVVSFNEGVLTIALTGGGEVSGKVTEATRLECEGTEEDVGDDDGMDGSGDHSSISGPRDDMGGGSSSADDQGGDNEGDDSAPACTTAALVAGATVNEAELAIGPAGAVWEKVELGS